MLPDGTGSDVLQGKYLFLEALLLAERDGVAALNEVISILKLEIMQLAARIMPATQE